jgi:LysR family hydrogen peroxide-inducible transcriptional activator
MNIRDLEYLVAVADKRHFGQAAKSCNVSQPALSAQIRKLEEQLGLQLFERAPRNVVPTPAAKFVIDTARVILEKTADIKKHAHFLRNGQQPKIVHLGVIPTIAPYYLPEFFKHLGEGPKQPSIRWQILEEKTEVLTEQLDDGRIDAAIMVVMPSGTPHAHKKLLDDQLFLAVPKGHALSRKDEIVPRDLEDEELLLLNDGHCLNTSMLDICERAHNPARQNSFRATSLETLRHMVASQSGITLLPAMARRKHDGIVYIPMKDTQRYTRQISLVWRRDSLNAAELAAIAERLREPSSL